MNEQYEYTIDSTLLKSHLIRLDKIGVPQGFKYGVIEEITVKIDDIEKHEYRNCHIDITQKHRLRVPAGVIAWIKKNYPFTVAYITSGNGVAWDVDSLKNIKKAKKENRRIDNPRENILLSWEKTDAEHYSLIIKKGSYITIEAARETLSEKALTSVYPFIYSSISNVNIPEHVTENKVRERLGSVFGNTTGWLSAEEYSKTFFPYGGVYILRRAGAEGYEYYVGKAININNRVIAFKNGTGYKIAHPDEMKNIDKQYDDILCAEILVDSIREKIGGKEKLNKEQINAVLYYVEDIVIHFVTMMLHSEGKKLKNRQFKSATSNNII